MLRLIRLGAGGAGLALLALWACIAQADAQEYCVACTGPTAVYRCTIDGARPGGSQPLQTLCVTAMAKEGQHAACNVKGGTVFDCNGPVKRVSWAAYNEQPSKATGPEKAKPPQASQRLPPVDDPSQPPRTVEEMAKRANQKTAEQIKKANEDMKDNAESFGDKVGDGTKKTWRCITSLFTRCTD